mmetsp:Transcript_12797/g.16523  ORF Transcript_12797/g.16523 Transcript_12797/m.16523 type:complete len:87 (-) Transcript_12797:1813-2073(-)
MISLKPQYHFFSISLFLSLYFVTAGETLEDDACLAVDDEEEEDDDDDAKVAFAFSGESRKGAELKSTFTSRKAPNADSGSSSTESP